MKNRIICISASCEKETVFKFLLTDLVGNAYFYWVNKYYNRLNTPAFIVMNEYGQIITTCFEQYNRLHRTNGPAYVNYKKNIKEYYLKGKRISIQDFYIEKIKTICEKE